jgi:hypothetical protein
MNQGGLDFRWGLWIRGLPFKTPVGLADLEDLGAQLETLASMIEEQRAWALWISDSLTPMGLDGATLLASLSVLTSRILLGLMEDRKLLFDNPALSTKAISSLNLLSHGRALWGLWDIPDLCLSSGEERAKLLGMRRRLLRGELVTEDIFLGPVSGSPKTRSGEPARHLEIEKAVCLPVLTGSQVPQYVSTHFLESTLPELGHMASVASSQVVQGVLMEGPLEWAGLQREAVGSRALQAGLDPSEVDWVWVLPAQDALRGALEVTLRGPRYSERSFHLRDLPQHGGLEIAKAMDPWTAKALEEGFDHVLIRFDASEANH